MPRIPGYSSTCIACVECQLILTLAMKGADADIGVRDGVRLEPSVNLGRPLEEAAIMLGWRRDLSQDHHPTYCRDCARKRHLGCIRCCAMEHCSCLGGPRLDARPV